MPAQDTEIVLIDLVEKHINKRFYYWKNGGIYIASLFAVENSYRIDIWNRSAGILVNNKWYGWREIDKPLTPIHSADPRFFREIIKDCREAFVRTGTHCHWNRQYPRS